jgi:lipopolysaccharide transport system ATP-binding protein
MSSVIVRAEHVGKQYRIGAARPRDRTLAASILDSARAPFRRAAGQAVSRAAESLVWALRDISFEVRHGEVLGVIGRNGAGKSTLLKVLSRITEPTVGRVEVHGRVGSLLEVGTGFHPELTGRDNVYLNGSILGMDRAYIDRRFEEIVEFSGVSRFIDTPVKRYSSGMYLRLAFAVAAHLEPDVLILDEVLAVGDASFQKKCLGKMRDVASHGRTVLFVSHDMAAVTRLCTRALLIHDGTVAADGPTHEVARLYMKSGLGTRAAREWPDARRAAGNHVARLVAARVCAADGRTTEAADIRRPVGVELTYDVLESGHVLVPNFHFTNEEGVRVFVLHDTDPEWRRRPRPAGRYTSTAWIPGNFLAEGMLVVTVALSTHDPLAVHCLEEDAVAFQVVDSLDGDTARGDYVGPMPGVVRPLVEWTTRGGGGLVAAPNTDELPMLEISK